MKTTEKVSIGVIGCGKISSIYLQAPRTFDILNIVACSDQIRERAESQAAEFGIPKVLSVEEMLADPEIEVVLNLTIPQVHATIGMAALEAGKAVYGEKPLALDREEGLALLRLAQQRKLHIGSAPDTFLGGGIQTCIDLINSGAIGTPIAATAFCMGHGPEGWHPDPNFFYQPGAGPLFDMGPYYLTALIAMMGPVQRVSSSTRVTFPERLITSQPHAGEIIKVNTPTHIAGTLDFANGAIATLITSFDIWHHNLPNIEIYGTEGSLRVPDPNTFGGPVLLRRMDEAEWREIPLTRGYTDNSRGIGLADMAYSLRTGTPHRANETLAYHVLDIMQTLHESAQAGRHITLDSTCSRPAALDPRIFDQDALSK
ncbi:MAG TPA: Gfo/Idh/MocA family oxidoreductase [Ktedonobacteraceae bacterium]|nr:Gfo/Idh/MocA family oxidoreductase [Ktedonobacteraceae bacterium]